MVKHYDFIDGLKTGYTSKSKYCLTATGKKDDVRLISVIMKAESSASRNQMTKTLLDYGFSKIKAKKLYYKDSVISTIKLDKVLSLLLLSGLVTVIVYVFLLPFS